ncbi:hypothetical protein [Tardiphaga sp. 619_E2_N8_5]|uniref:hypothetical protein n=1 Tax=unclassified Tardiphaga TaxID=2631404 RepID=UPI003F26A57B
MRDALGSERTMIARRHVFHIGGYDPILPDTQLERFRRSLSSFEKTWSVSAKASGVLDATDVSASWRAETSGPNWKTETTYEMLRWDDLILQDHTRSMLSRLGAAFVTLGDWLMTGTLFRFFYASWKYAGFFLFSYLWIAGFAASGAAVGYGLTWLLGMNGAAAWIAGAIVAAAVFTALLHHYGWRKPINHVFDDWIFSRQYVHGQRPKMTARVDEFAGVIVARAQKADVDEIVIVGHCLGAALVMEAVARALALDPDLTKHGPTICVMTVSATIPKFALHPAGKSVRAATRLVADTPAIRWTEYHARDDVISFYRFDPVTLKRRSRDRDEGRPNIRRVQMHAMMGMEQFKRYRFNFMRIHYQMVMGNQCRAPYDYCMVICGPLPFDEITAGEGGLKRFGADGALLDMPLSKITSSQSQAGASVNAA